MKVLIVSNLDSSEPVGQFIRPYFLGRGLATNGVEVANVGVDCSRIDFGPVWSTGAKSLLPLARATRTARRSFRPDVVYAQEMRPLMAAAVPARGLPLAVDFHSLPSVEWSGFADRSAGRQALRYRLLAMRSRQAERLAARRADCIIAASSGLASDVAERLRPRAEPIAVPNGVDPQLLEAPAGPSPFDAADGTRQAVTTLPSVGSPSNELAREFVKAVAIELERLTPRVAVNVLGTDSGPQAPLVHYRGFVPDLLAWIAHADVCLLPYPAEAALSGGARNKLLEFLARGRSIVTTEEGLRGLEEAAAWDGVHVTSDEPAAFAAAMVQAVGDGLPKLRANGDEHSMLSWDVRAQQVGEALTALVNGRPS